MAHPMQSDRLAYLFEDDIHSSEASNSGAITLSPADAVKQAVHALLAFQATKTKEYIDEAVELAQHATDSAPSGDDKFAEYLTTLGAILNHHYKAFGDESSLHGAVEAARRAVEVSKHDDPNLDMYIHNLETALAQRYHHSSDNKHVDESISIMQHVSDQLSPGSRAAALYPLLKFQTLSFENTSDERRLDEAISTNRLLLDTSDKDDRIDLLWNLGELCDWRLDRHGTGEHLDESIRIWHGFLEATPAEDDRRCYVFQTLNMHYSKRYLQSECLEDLRQVIEFSQKTIGATDNADLLLRLSLLGHLAQKFMMWYSREKEFPPLDESILDRHLGGNKTDSDDHAEKAFWLYKLSSGLEERVSRMEPSQNSLNDLEISMLLVYEALELTCDQHGYWEEMVIALRRRQRLWSDRTGKIPDTPETATVRFRSGTKLLELNHTLMHKDLLRTPYWIMHDDLDAIEDEAREPTIRQCLVGDVEVINDKHSLIQL
ncbi:hypothetical protein N8I77_009817 [Diaporthe amygdali]|uniref:Uncharacterized protein n=1 Tax=Phomopsis amygdali TaxID=1214568 RepID=A0AAD9SDE2_PHOAM|nr:hypothetical protein N8I77_009817 [Diaporthe amygdali]